MLSLLATAGISIFNSLVSKHGEELVSKGIEKVTGIKLEEKQELTEKDKALIIDKAKEIKDMILKDVQDAREHSIGIQNSNAPLWVKMNRTLTGQVTILLSFALFFFVLTGGVDLQNSNVALIVGASIGYVSQILSFLFGSTESNHTYGGK